MNLTQLNFTHLAAFHAAAITGSVTAAARRLHVSQPALTREIRELEARLGVTLFDRLPRGMQLTEAGRLLAEFSTQIFHLAASAETALGEFAGLTRGHVALVASHTVGVYLLPGLIDTFNSRYPGVTLDLAITNSEAVQRALVAQERQLGWVEGPYDTDVFDAVCIGDDEIVAVAGSRHPYARRRRLSAADLDNGELVMREAGSGTREALAAAYAAQGLVLAPAVSIASAQAITRLLRLGRAISWVSRRSVTDELAAGVLVELAVSDLRVARPLQMIWRKGQALSPAARAFRDLTARQMPDARPR